MITSCEELLFWAAEEGCSLLPQPVIVRPKDAARRIQSSFFIFAAIPYLYCSYGFCHNWYRSFHFLVPSALYHGNLCLSIRLKRFWRQKRNDFPPFAGSHSRGTNTITAAKPCSAFFPRFPSFPSKNDSPNRFLDNTSPFAAVCHGRVAAAAATTSRCCAEHTIDTSVC